MLQIMTDAHSTIIASSSLATKMTITCPSPPQATAWILQLPDELLIKIFGHLPPLDRILAAAVCQKWKRLAFDGTLWTCIKVVPFLRSIPSGQLLRLSMAGGKFLKVLNFRGCIHLTGHELRTLSEHCPNVRDLQLKDCRSLSTHSIALFLQTANRLHTLNLSGLDTITNSTLQLVGQLTTLEKLDIGWCRNVTGPGVQAVATQCLRLRNLKLNGCSQLDDDLMDALGRNLSNLTHLNLSCCTSLTDGALLAFLSHQSDHGAPLSHLILSSCPQLSDTSLRHIALHCSSFDQQEQQQQQQQHLSHLDLAGCVLLTDQGFSYLAPRLRTLVHLDLEDLPLITGVTVTALANTQPHLRWLCLSSCTQVSDDAIVHLVLHGASRRIEHLELDNCTVTDHALDMISIYLKDLQLQVLLQQNKIPSTSGSGLGLVIPDNAVRSLYIEVLDCSCISQDGIKSAIAKAGSLLTIKSFYSWQGASNQENGDEDEDDAMDAFRPRRTRREAASAVTTGRGRYNTIGFHRRRPEAARQPYASNCIIL